MIAKLPVGVAHPGLPDAIGAIRLTLPRSTRYALCSERLMITLVPERIVYAFIELVSTGRGGAVTTRSWETQPAASDAKRMIKDTILFIYHFHLMILSDGGSLVESGGSFQFGVAREKRLTDMMNVVPLDQLLPYSSRCVTVAFAYGEKLRRAEDIQGGITKLC
jgi:hypothetical protein